MDRHEEMHINRKRLLDNNGLLSLNYRERERDKRQSVGCWLLVMDD